MELRKENVLIVDDDIGILELLQRHLLSWNLHCYKAISVKEAVAILRDAKIDLLITDLKMPHVDGFELIKFVSEHYPQIPKLVITGYPSVQGSLQSIKSGVADYLTKPFTKQELAQAIEKSIGGLEANVQQNKKVALPKIKNQPKPYKEIVGKSDAIKKVFQLMDRVKDNKATVLINGESGTGKELVAQGIHFGGKFSRAPFIPVNCGAIAENLLESELFGYVKGAYTGADSTRDGYFQAANGGTLFLDEIGSASLAVQTRLLRVLQEREVVKVGSRKPEKIEVRVIAATNEKLTKLIEAKRFREDLYYRLTVVEIEMPPLRKRIGDIPLLVERFLFKYGLEYRNGYVKIDDEALGVLKRYSWPGNVRELENVVQRAVIMGNGSLGLEHLPDTIKYQIDFPDDDLMPLKEVERRYIQKVLNRMENNKTKAAEILGITRKTLRKKLVN
ncbi:sigma-54-dependent transcriptional regulator [Euzebyella saccharophila]|uniref:Sigma-54-dependent transcriptional regulator n=1 Tax=Euzebyella saccharophila TaxID=679664 RepID=A0ABV8JQM1_9FLAO|nr:sigma-54 dependent transcriptional regulator [Euzebyella saccharophila]